jgi:hypothetical protein
MIRQDLPLVLYDRILIAQDSGLIADHQLKATLVSQHPLLIRDDLQLILECRRCHACSFVVDFNVNLDHPALA